MHPKFKEASETQGGITYAQGMEIWERFHTNGQTVQTVAAQMGCRQNDVMDCLDGRSWPAVRRYWYDNAKPIPEFVTRDPRTHP